MIPWRQINQKYIVTDRATSTPIQIVWNFQSLVLTTGPFASLAHKGNIDRRLSSFSLFNYLTEVTLGEKRKDNTMT